MNKLLALIIISVHVTSARSNSLTFAATALFMPPLAAGISAYAYGQAREAYLIAKANNTSEKELKELQNRLDSLEKIKIASYKVMETEAEIFTLPIIRTNKAVNSGAHICHSAILALNMSEKLHQKYHDFYGLIDHKKNPFV